MGQDIHQLSFTAEDFKHFSQQLAKETELLNTWLQQRVFDTGESRCGFELESVLIDSQGYPAPMNQAFLEAVGSPYFVPELAKYNFEINSHPHDMSPGMLSNMHAELKDHWLACQRGAEHCGVDVMCIGILPTYQESMFGLDAMTPRPRYAALNEQVMKMRNHRSVTVNIEGTEHLEYQSDNIMSEAASTSLQIHIQVQQDTAARYYNAAHIVSAPMIALAANSPFLFGKSLWEETRIPLFEQAVCLKNGFEVDGECIGRTSFGSGYIRESAIEVFQENLEHFSPLLPIHCDESPALMKHLSLHNGTVWRWNRLLVGFNGGTQPHLRLEHRVPAAGPTHCDMVANMAFYLGVVMALATQPKPPEQQITFKQVKQDFYRAAQYGLNTEIQWLDGRRILISTLLLDVLVPMAKQSLLARGFSEKDVTFYLDDIITKRVETRQTGASWQRAYVARHGRNFQDLVNTYRENARSDRPVHQWK